jgi:hypothetical protein
MPRSGTIRICPGQRAVLPALRGAPITSLDGVDRAEAQGQTLRGRFRLEHRRVVTTPSGKRFVVTATPRSIAGDPEFWPLPWPILFGWVTIRQCALWVRRQPGWQVEVTPAWEPEGSRIVARTSRADAIRRVDIEVSALAGGDA